MGKVGVGFNIVRLGPRKTRNLWDRTQVPYTYQLGASHFGVNPQYAKLFHPLNLLEIKGFTFSSTTFGKYCPPPRLRPHPKDSGQDYPP